MAWAAVAVGCHGDYRIRYYRLDTFLLSCDSPPKKLSHYSFWALES